MSRQSEWFKHDDDALFDDKCSALCLRYGPAGYGAFWGIVEAMRRSPDYRIKLTSRVVQQTALCLRMEASELTDMIEVMASEEVELLSTDGEWYWSESLNRRMEKYDEMLQAQQEGGRIGAARRWHGDNGHKAERVAEEVDEDMPPIGNLSGTYSTPNGVLMGSDSELELDLEREGEEEKIYVGLPPDQIAKPPPLPITETTKTIITYLNQKADTRFNPAGKAHRQLIGALLKKGYTEADMKKIIVVKAIKWRGDEKMAQYLRPSTLFRPSHVDDYIGEYETEKANAQG